MPSRRPLRPRTPGKFDYTPPGRRRSIRPRSEFIAAEPLVLELMHQRAFAMLADFFSTLPDPKLLFEHQLDDRR